MGKGGGRKRGVNGRDDGRINGGGTGTVTMGNNAKRFGRPHLGRGGDGRGKGLAGAAGGGCHDGKPPGWPSQIPRPEPGGQAAGGGGGKRNGSPVPSPPRCVAVPPALLPGRAEGDDGDHGARAVACGNAGNGNPLGNDDAATAAIAGKADNVGQENNDHGGDDGDDDKNNDKWRRGA